MSTQPIPKELVPPANEMLATIEKLFIGTLNTLQKKNKDYSTSDDPFYNFKFSAKLAHCSVEQSMLVRIADKISRMANLLQNGKLAAVKEEPIEDTIKDTIGYLAILYAYRLAQQQRDAP
jgi:hypothetical protein